MLELEHNSKTRVSWGNAIMGIAEGVSKTWNEDGLGSKVEAVGLGLIGAIMVVASPIIAVGVPIIC